jgi:putative flippase GtrA
MWLKNKIALFTDKTFMKFVMVGVVNTIVGTTIMFVFYNVFHFGYWTSSAANYFFGSICSYLLNKHFTFQYHERGWWSLLRFTVNILVCYLLAYGMAKPIINWLLTGFSKSIRENISMALGMCLFVVFNYLGQRFFAFRKTSRQSEAMS